MTNNSPPQQEDAEVRCIFAPRSGRGRSILDLLTPEDRVAMKEWASSQRSNPDCDGVANVMAWPGWRDVLERKQPYALVSTPSP